ncbi:hypothetical protein PT2222_10269 [Paraburkholderia tropica]
MRSGSRLLLRRAAELFAGALRHGLEVALVVIDLGLARAVVHAGLAGAIVLAGLGDAVAIDGVVRVRDARRRQTRERGGDHRLTAKCVFHEDSP